MTINEVALMIALTGVALATVAVTVYLLVRHLQQIRTTWAKVIFIIIVLVVITLPTLYMLGY